MERTPRELRRKREDLKDIMERNRKKKSGRLGMKWVGH
jgi:hypothetical protein